MQRLAAVWMSLLVVVAAPLYAQTQLNILRNGSFEGSLLYWHNIQPDEQKIIAAPDAPSGQSVLRIEKGYVMSAPFECKRGENISLSFAVKGDRAGHVKVQIPPSAREPGQNAHRLWTGEATQSAAIGTDWQRVSFTYPANVPQTGFWPNPNYMVLIEADVPIEIDAVCVTLGDKAPAAYEPRRPIEVVADCTNLPGYEAKGNIFESSAAADIVANVFNPGKADQHVTVRWQCYDYEGKQPIGDSIERQVTIPAGHAYHHTEAMKLIATGTLLARVSAIVDGRVIDSSDFPVTSLRYPMGLRKPDERERFGGSFYSGVPARLGSVIGFAWSRWYPHSEWGDTQPDGPDSWVWFDKQLDELESLGISAHMVMYGWPKWAMDPTNAPNRSPLPKDMRWAANDPRWEDLSVETSWDRFVKKYVDHYRGRHIVYEIENEPQFDRWEHHEDQYAQFTIRTAKLIHQVDPKAKVMVNNVYGIPSTLNRRLLERGGGKFIDIISWHDYHEGWLADAAAMRRMKANLASLGAGHVAIWFNEGWAFTNTAVDEPIACTHLSCAQSVNAQMDSVAELSANGQAKTILFHTGYATHGMSFWDYSGPGTMLWDWYNNPLPLVPAWNTMCHHVGLSRTIGFIRPIGANLCIFQDERDHEGVIVTYADRDAKQNVTLDLPLDGMIVEDLMGNASPLNGHQLTLDQSGRPVFIYTKAKTSGQTMYKQLESQDRSHASFVTAAGGGAATVTYALPPVWRGKTDGAADGNPVMLDGRPVWQLDQVWPPTPDKPDSYHPLTWSQGWWIAAEHSAGGQPKVELKDDGVRLEFRAPQNDSPGEKIASLSFIAPTNGTYHVHGSVTMRMWSGGNVVTLRVMHGEADGGVIMRVASIKLNPKAAVSLDDVAAKLHAGDRLMFVPDVAGMFNGGDFTLHDLKITRGEVGKAPSGVAYHLPQSWTGGKVGSSAGNPIMDRDRAIWRLDQLWPDDPIMAANYRPMIWKGAEWNVAEHGHGGQPAVQVDSGHINFAVAGPWGGAGNDHQRTAALTFIVPTDGVYRISGVAHAKPWTGGAKTFRLGILKKDTQRAVLLKTVTMPRDDSAVAFELDVDVTAGHELLMMPLMDGMWNNAANVRVDDLTITQKQ